VAFGAAVGAATALVEHSGRLTAAELLHVFADVPRKVERPSRRRAAWLHGARCAERRPPALLLLDATGAGAVAPPSACVMINLTEVPRGGEFRSAASTWRHHY